MILEINYMMTSLLTPLKHTIDRISHKEVFGMSVGLSLLLHYLGLDTTIAQFIIILTFIDLGTKWYSLTVEEYCKFSIINLMKTIHSGVINSNKLRTGVFSKLTMYIILIYISATLLTSGIKDHFVLAEFVSQFIFSILIITEIISILENFRDCGYSIANILLKVVHDKSKKYMETGECSSDKSDIKSDESKIKCVSEPNTKGSIEPNEAQK